MLLSLRKAFVIVVMVLVLLAGLFGWSFRMATMPVTHHHSSIQSIQKVSDDPGPAQWYCPGPPRSC